MDLLQQLQQQIPILSAWSLLFFLLIVSLILVQSFPSLFLSSHGRSHRLMGATYWFCLWVGVIRTIQHSYSYQSTMASAVFFFFAYDICLATLGSLLTWTAAQDFPHKHVQNAPGQSGTLHQRAMVTQAEMMEHLFYQVLNLWQSLYLHSIEWYKQEGMASTTSGTVAPLVLLASVTAPWWIRQQFPVHSFSNNWKQLGSRPSDVEVFLYRIKKLQYLFYKHVILHGINVWVAVVDTRMALVYNPSFRIFWLLLHTSYVMEFFLQSLVKRHVLSQSSLLILQRWLMLTASLSAMDVLQHMVLASVAWWHLPAISALSVTLNLVHRHHDVLNTMGIGVLATLLLRQ